MSQKRLVCVFYNNHEIIAMKIPFVPWSDQRTMNFLHYKNYFYIFIIVYKKEHKHKKKKQWQVTALIINIMRLSTPYFQPHDKLQLYNPLFFSIRQSYPHVSILTKTTYILPSITMHKRLCIENLRCMATA